MIHPQQLIQNQQSLVEILKPMTPKERHEYIKNRMYEKKDILKGQIEKYKKENPYATGLIAANDITDDYINNWSDKYEVYSYDDMDLGKLYTFYYPESGSIEIQDKGTLVPSKRMPYFDPNPIIIFCGYHNYNGTILVTGINLKYLHPYVRTEILNYLRDAWKGKEDIFYKSNFNHRIIPNNSFNFQQFYQTVLNVLETLRIVELGIRRYDVKNITNLKRIALSDYTKVAIMGTDNKTRYISL
ncbi:MAG: hypothetical protein FWC41_03455 [Firmicutes bacterium]|nr:hypothetical protein [Bacillota bacterium]